MNPAVAVQTQITIARLVDVVIAFMLLEFITLAWRRRQRGPAVLTVFLALAPGMCLTLALRVAVGGANWIWVGACLAAALPFHLADVRRRGL
jgi:hypothetical protein